MTIELKDTNEIERLRQSNRIVALVLHEVAAMMKPGVTTLAIDRLAETIIRDHGAEPAFKGYRGFPASACISLNQEIVHGIPSQRELKEGDIVSVDIGTKLGGFYGDGAYTFCIQPVASKTCELVSTTKTALDAAIAAARCGKTLGEVSQVIYATAKQKNYGVIRDYVGHGIGRHLHEDPQVPNYVGPWRSLKLEPGLVIALEPMFTLGDYHTRVLADNWTVVTRDNSMSAHFEHTICITDDEPEILTKL